MLNHLDLFSGLGGFSDAAQEFPNIKTNQFVELEPYCQKVLGKKHKGILIHADVRTFRPRAPVGVITAGFPCQDISSASDTRSGLNGDRSGLFFEVMRIVRTARPRYLVLENSAVLLTHRDGSDMRTILWELSQLGYDALWSVVSACSVGASHMRERLFIVAYPNSFNVEGLAFQQEYKRAIQKINDRPRPKLWASEPPPSRMADGIANREHRMLPIGNPVLPEVARVPLAIVSAMEEAREAIAS